MFVFLSEAPLARSDWGGNGAGPLLIFLSSEPSGARLGLLSTSYHTSFIVKIEVRKRVHPDQHSVRHSLKVKTSLSWHAALTFHKQLIIYRLYFWGSCHEMFPIFLFEHLIE